MAIFFFDVHDVDYCRDEVGVECADFDAVRTEAKKVLPAIARDLFPQDGDHQTIRVIVRDQQDGIVYTATLTFNGQPHDAR